MKPLTKTPWKNLPLSLPMPQAEFFERTAEVLGVSRNTILCLALRIGGPILHHHAQRIRGSVKDACEAVERLPAGKASEILGAGEIRILEAINAANERRKPRSACR
jgi:hypothetical protein